MRTRAFLAIALTAMLALAACGDDSDSTDTSAESGSDTTAAAAGDANYSVTLKGGAAQIEKPGDPDGGGTAAVTLKGDGNACFEFKATNIDKIVAAHIHKGSATVAGPIVVDFQNATGASSGCAEAKDKAVFEEIAGNPGEYYVNIHTGPFPGGAVRGQLAKGGSGATGSAGAGGGATVTTAATGTGADY